MSRINFITNIIIRFIIGFVKYFTITVFFIFLLMITKKYGNYKENVYEIFIIPFITFLLFINITILYFIQKKSNNFKTLLIIISVGVAGIIFNLIMNYFSKNRKTLYELEIHSKKSDKKFDIYLYTNDSFEIINYSPHIFQHWNGKYKISNDTLYLRNVNLKQSSELELSEKYIYNKTEKTYFSDGLTYLKLKK